MKIRLQRKKSNQQEQENKVPNTNVFHHSLFNEGLKQRLFNERLHRIISNHDVIRFNLGRLVRNKSEDGVDQNEVIGLIGAITVTTMIRIEGISFLVSNHAQPFFGLILAHPLVDIGN